MVVRSSLVRSHAPGSDGAGWTVFTDLEDDEARLSSVKTHVARTAPLRRWWARSMVEHEARASAGSLGDAARRRRRRRAAVGEVARHEATRRELPPRAARNGVAMIEGAFAAALDSLPSLSPPPNRTSTTRSRSTSAATSIYRATRQRVGVLEGDFAEGIAVRADALQAALGLPLRVRSGFAARIRVRVPWHALRTEPVQILVEGLVLNVLAEPHDPSAAADPVLPSTAPAAAAATGAAASTPKSTVDAYVERFAALLMQNVAVTLERVYVLYQDERLSRHRFALSLSLDELSLRAADANWRPAFVDANTWRRRAELRGLSVGFRRLPNAADARPDGRAAAATPRPSSRAAPEPEPEPAPEPPADEAAASEPASPSQSRRRRCRRRRRRRSPRSPPGPAAARASGARPRPAPPRRGPRAARRPWLRPPRRPRRSRRARATIRGTRSCCGAATRRCWCRRAAAARGSSGAGCRCWRCG